MNKHVMSSVVHIECVEVGCDALVSIFVARYSFLPLPLTAEGTVLAAVYVRVVEKVMDGFSLNFENKCSHW